MKTKFNDFINEGYDRSKDDYRYFRGLISDEVEQKWVESIRSKRSDWVNMMLASARGHWSIGDGDSKKFPRAEFLKVINNVLDDYIGNGKKERKPIIFKSRNNEQFKLIFKFDDKGRLDGVSNKWDVGFPDWWGLDVSDKEIIEYFKRNYPEYYVVESIDEKLDLDNIMKSLKKAKKEDIKSGSQFLTIKDKKPVFVNIKSMIHDNICIDTKGDEYKLSQLLVLDESIDSKIPFDDEITSELRKLYKNTITEKTGGVEERIKLLLRLHSKWLEKATMNYSAEDIAEKLFKYDKDIHNGKV